VNFLAGTKSVFLDSLRIDMCLPIRGTWVPLDHGYSLFSALCRVRTDLHGCEWLAVHPITGSPGAAGRLVLTDASALVLRVPRCRIEPLSSLAQRTLWVNGQDIYAADWLINELTPSSALVSRLVVVKGYTEPECFAAAIARQLLAIGVDAQVQIGRRRAITINGDRVVGFAVKLSGLSAHDSLLVQSAGIGGRQRMGCGIFTPSELAQEHGPDSPRR